MCFTPRGSGNHASGSPRAIGKLCVPVPATGQSRIFKESLTCSRLTAALRVPVPVTEQLRLKQMIMTRLITVVCASGKPELTGVVEATIHRVFDAALNRRNTVLGDRFNCLAIWRLLRPCSESFSN